MGAQNTQNREIFNQNITKNVSKISKMYPKNGLKWCNIAEIGGYVLRVTSFFCASRDFCGSYV